MYILASAAGSYARFSLVSIAMPNQLPPLPSCTVAVVGLGYVGLPLAVAFGTPAACARTGAPLARRVDRF
jgi:hypothetical protein